MESIPDIALWEGNVANKRRKLRFQMSVCPKDMPLPWDAFYSLLSILTQLLPMLCTNGFTTSESIYCTWNLSVLKWAFFILIHVSYVHTWRTCELCPYMTDVLFIDKESRASIRFALGRANAVLWDAGGMCPSRMRWLFFASVALNHLQ